MKLKLLSIGDQVEPGAYRFHSCFDHVVNFERDGRLLSVVDEPVGPGPLNIVFSLNNTPLQRGGRAPAGELNPESFRDFPPGAKPADLQETVKTVKDFHPPGRTPLKRGVNESAPHETGTYQEILGLPSPPALEIGRNTITFAGCGFRFSPRHRYQSTIVLKPTILHRFQRNLRTFGESLQGSAPPKSLAFLLDDTRLANFQTKSERAFAAHMAHSVHQVFHGHLLQGIRSLKGCGPGLTPSGDDFIAGLLVGLHVLGQLESAPDRSGVQSRTLRANPTASERAQRPGLRQSSGAFEKGLVFLFEASLSGQPGAGSRSCQALADAIFSAARGRNLFSNTFLDLARQGRFVGRVKDLLLTLATGDKPTVRRATQRLLAIGASSGADLATGFCFTIDRIWVHSDPIAAAAH